MGEKIADTSREFKFSPNYLKFMNDAINKGITYEAAVAASIIRYDVNLEQFFTTSICIYNKFFYAENFGLIGTVRLFTRVLNFTENINSLLLEENILNQVKTSTENIIKNLKNRGYAKDNPEPNKEFPDEALQKCINTHFSRIIYMEIANGEYMNVETSHIIKIRDSIICPKYISFPNRCSHPIQIDEEEIKTIFNNNESISNGITMVQDEFLPTINTNLFDVINGNLAVYFCRLHLKEALEMECKRVCNDRNVIWIQPDHFYCPKNYHLILEDFILEKINKIRELLSSTLTIFPLGEYVNLSIKNGWVVYEPIYPGDCYACSLYIDKVTAFVSNPSMKDVFEYVNDNYGQVEQIIANEFSFEQFDMNLEQKLPWGLIIFKSKFPKSMKIDSILGMDVKREIYINPIDYYERHKRLIKKYYTINENKIIIQENLFQHIKNYLKMILIDLQTREFYGEIKFIITKNNEIEIQRNAYSEFKLYDIIEKIYPYLQPVFFSTKLILCPSQKTLTKLKNDLMNAFNVFIDIKDDNYYIFGSKVAKNKVLKYLDDYYNYKVSVYCNANLGDPEKYTDKDLINLQKILSENVESFFIEKGAGLSIKIKAKYRVAQIIESLLDDDDEKEDDSSNLWNIMGHLVDTVELEDVPNKKYHKLEREIETKNECVTCFSEVAKGIRMLNCGHYYCKSCYKQQMDVNITKDVTIPIFCSGCNYPLNNVDINQAGNYSTKLKSLALESLIKRDKSFIHCSNILCLYGIVSLTVEYSYRCLLCGQNVCKMCNEIHEENESCSSKRQLFYLEFKKWVIEDTQNRRICPNCKHGIEKNGGCSQVSCRGCSKSICWKCFDFFDNSTQCYNHLTKMHGGY